MYYVYTIQSEKYPNRFYSGFSNDPMKRLLDHNSGKSTHTKMFKPWKLIFHAAFTDKQTALNFERYLKTASGIAFRNKRLINQNSN